MKIQIWEHYERGVAVDYTCAPKPQCEELLAKRVIDSNAVLIHEFEARTWFEAMTKYHEYMGFEPYQPPTIRNGGIDPAVFKLL